MKKYKPDNIGASGIDIKTTSFEFGLLVAVTDAMSNRIFMTYDNKGNLTSLQDKKGGITTYTYDAEGILLTQKTDAMGNVTEYEYYSKGEATSVQGIDIRQSGLVKSIILHKTDKNGVTIPDFQRTTYRYEDDYNYITSITDGVGNTTSYRYDSVGRVIEQVDPRGNSVYFSYDMMNRLLSQTDSLGNEQIYTYDGVGNRISSTDKLGATTYYEYDSKNQLVKVIDPMGYGITYQYDPRGNLVRETNPKGGETRYVYDSINRLVMKTDPLGHTTVYEYDVDPEGNQNDPDYHNVKVIDAEGNVSITEYDCLNRVVVEKQLLENPYYGSASKEIAVTYTYDLNDNIETVTDPMGKVTKYNYDDLNRMISVTDGFGLGGKLESTTETEFDAKADADGNVSIVTVIDPSGERTQTYYDAIDRKIKEVDAKGYETLYSYDGIGNLLTTTDPEGNTNTFEYDEINRVIKAYDAENNYITYEYDANGNKTAEVDRKGNRTEFIYDRNNRLIQIIDALSGITNYTYDEMGNIATETDPENNTKAYQYNDAGMLICEEDAENNSKYYTYDALGRVTFESGWINPGIGITTEYDEAGRVKQIIDALGNSTEYTYDLVGNMKTLKDANGNITAYEYDQRYQLVTEIEPGDSSVDENQINYEYDELGRLVKKQDSFGTVTELEYDQLSQLTGTIVRDENNQVKIAEYKTYNGNGQVLTQTDGNSVTTTYEYNSLNLLKTQTKDGKTTSYTYDNNSNLQAETDWRGNTYTYSYDELNRLQQKRDPYNNTIETLVYYKNGAQKQSIDALGNVTTFYYDGNGRLVKTEDPEGNIILTEYDGDGNVIRSTDGGGNTTEYEYDSAARLISVRNALNETTAYTYDHNGNMLTQKDGEGNITTYKYNVRNLPYQRIDDGGEGVASKTESYTYYANNLLKTKTDRNGTVISYTYDVFGRLQKEIAGSLQTSYTYDNNGNPLTINDSIGTTIRTYDAMNRVTSKTVPNMGTVTYEYDIIEGVGTGETAERTADPKGNVTTKIYDCAGRLKAVIDGDITSTDITTYEYYDNGSRQSVTYPTGIKEEYTYYPDNTLWTLTNKDADGTILDVYTYTYDEANNQTSKHEVINGVDKGTTSYIYDRLNRLLTVTEPSGRETGYTYDMAGNRTMELISSGSETISNIYSYNEQNRLVYITTQVDSELTEKTEYCYDHNGNQLETIVTEYIDGVAQTPVTAAVNTYDSKNQLIETVTADGTTLTNAYNGEGLRVSKTVNGQTTTFLYEYNKVVLETNADGTEKARNLYGTNLLMRTVDGESYYYLYNGHADVTALIDTDGNIAATYYYDAFGNILEQTGDVDNNITYAGYQYDDETGLYYLNARMYDPKIARFLQEDTYRGNSNDPLSLNLYTYCANNPMVYYDPTGHNLASLWDNLKTGFNTLFQKSEEERQNDFDLIYEYGNKDGYTKAITNVGGGLSAVGDLWNDPVKQMEENNEILFNSVKNKSNLYKYESLCIYGIETIKGTIQLGKTIGDTFGNAALAMIYDDKDYKIELSQNVETLKSIPGDMLNGIIDNAKTLVNLEKAYDFFINPDATLANNVEYMSAGISTGMTVYVGAKSLQSGHQFLKGIHINTGNMSAGMSGFSASAAVSSGISISVEAGVTASAQSAVQMGMLYVSTGFSGNEGTSKAANKVDGLAKEMKDWLGKDAKVITNKSGDKVFMSSDGTRRIRFDINNTSPHSNPHGHVEQLVNGKWVKSGPLYPVDVPQN